MNVQKTSDQFIPALQRSTTNVFAPIQREFDRLFDQLGSGWASFNEVQLAPQMDVRDTKDGLEITVELPGLSEKDVKVSVEDDVLTISGEKQTEKESKAEDYRLSERSYGAFSRSISLPSNVEAEKIKASMNNGVLKLVAPRNGKGHSKQIEIQTAS